MKFITPALCLATLFGISNASAQNAYLEGLTLPRFIKAGVNYDLDVRARNASATPFTNVSVSWRLDGGTIHTMPSFGIGGGGVVQNNYMPVSHPDPLNTMQGPHTLKIWVIIPNDTDHSNDTLTLSFTALSQWGDKVALMEARTETWCPQCPPSNTVTNNLQGNPDFAVAKFHLSDALDDCAECITYYNQHGINYTPAGIVEMGEYGTYAINSNHSTWLNDMTTRAEGVSPVILDVSSSLNYGTRQMVVTIDATFTYALTGPFKLNVYVVEDLVPGPQQNAPSNYIHNGVMRAMLGGAAGTSSVVPNSPAVGTTYSHTYNYTVPAGFKLADLRLIGVIEHAPGGFNDRYSLNAKNSGASAVGMDERTDPDLDVFPNPFTNELTIEIPDLTGNARVELIGLDGRIVLDRYIIFKANERTRMNIDREFSEGTYFLRISTGSVVLVEQVVHTMK